MTKPLPLWSRNFEASSNINPEVESALSAAAGIALTFDSKMKPPIISRIGATIFGIVGLYWGFMLLMTMIFPPIGLFMNLLCLPGWISFFGWWHVAFAEPMIVRRRVFWIFSMLAHLWLAYLHSGKLSPEYSDPYWVFAVNWCLWISAFSALFAFLDSSPDRKPKEVEQAEAERHLTAP